jgi:4-hydroxy-2-oxoheptanedioate aldolase
VVVGPYDLSQSVGHPGEVDHRDVVAAGERLAEQVAGHAALGVYLERPERIGRWRTAGASSFTLWTDGRIFLDACRRTSSSFARRDDPRPCSEDQGEYDSPGATQATG